MSVKTFKDLIVWEKAHQFTLKIYQLTKGFPAEERFGLINQIRRSSISIPANITEGYKKTDKDFRRYLDISEASLEETKYHLLLSKDLGYCGGEDFNALSEMADEIGRLLYGLRKSIRLN